MPSLWVRSAFALGSLLRVETKWRQSGMKQTSISPIRLSDDQSVLANLTVTKWQTVEVAQ